MQVQFDKVTSHKLTWWFIFCVTAIGTIACPCVTPCQNERGYLVIDMPWIEFMFYFVYNKLVPYSMSFSHVDKPAMLFIAMPLSLHSMFTSIFESNKSMCVVQSHRRPPLPCLSRLSPSLFHFTTRCAPPLQFNMPSCLHLIIVHIMVKVADSKRSKITR